MTASARNQTKSRVLPKLAAVAVAASLLTVPFAEAAWADVWHTCQPIAVAFYPKTRLHVKCSNPVNGIGYFAMRAKGKDAAMMLPLLSEALGQGLSVGVLYDPTDLSGEKFGCSSSDCRVMHAASIGP